MNSKSPEPSKLIPQRKRVKRSRGVPVIYDEAKKPRSIALTDTAVKAAKEFGKACGTKSLSTAVETGIRIVSILQRKMSIEQLQQLMQDENQLKIEVKSSHNQQAQ